MDPLTWLLAVDENDLAPPDDSVYAMAMYEAANRATLAHPRSVEAWRYKAEYSWYRAMCTQDPFFQFDLFCEVIDASRRLKDLGARKAAEDALLDAIRYPSDTVFAKLDGLYGLAAKGARLQYFDVDASNRRITAFTPHGRVRDSS